MHGDPGDVGRADTKRYECSEHVGLYQMAWQKADRGANWRAQARV